jgi:hypothetical protein
MMPVSVSRGRAAAAAFQLTLHALHPGSVSPYNLLNVPYSVKVELELVELRQDIVVPLDFGVGISDEITGVIKLSHGEYLTLLAEIRHLLFDLVHDPVKVPAKGCERCAIKEQQALARSSASIPRRARSTTATLAEGGLALPQELEFFMAEP